jgi:hypothetical protein
MQTIKLNVHIGKDGMLTIELPPELRETDAEVVVVVQGKHTRQWSPGFFERIIGMFADSPLERPAQGDYQERDDSL